MAVGAACQTGVAEVVGVVAGLLEGTKDEGRKGFATAARALDVVHDPHAHLPGDRGGGRGRELLGRGRRRHAQIGELLQQELDRLRVRPFVDAIERRALASGEQLGHRFVRGDHQLLDEPV